MGKGDKNERETLKECEGATDSLNRERVNRERERERERERGNTGRWWD